MIIMRQRRFNELLEKVKFSIKEELREEINVDIKEAVQERFEKVFGYDNPVPSVKKSLKEYYENMNNSHTVKIDLCEGIAETPYIMYTRVDEFIAIPLNIPHEGDIVSFDVRGISFVGGTGIAVIHMVDRVKAKFPIVPYLLPDAVNKAFEIANSKSYTIVINFDEFNDVEDGDSKPMIMFIDY